MTMTLNLSRYHTRASVYIEIGAHALAVRAPSSMITVQQHADVALLLAKQSHVDVRMSRAIGRVWMIMNACMALTDSAQFRLW